MKKVLDTNVEVSVCMITYKHADYIIEAISGVFNQRTDFNVELFISNDCSPDETDIIFNEFLKKTKIPENLSIRYVMHENNLGMAKNFLWSIQNCRGKYITLCEGDDYWRDPHKLQKQHDFLSENDPFILSFHDSFILDSEGKKSKYLEDFNKRDIGFEELSSGEYLIPTQSVMFRNIEGKFLPDSFLNVLNTDTFLFFLLSSKGKFHYHDDIENSVYRKHEFGVWSSKNSFQKVLSGYKTYIELKKIFPTAKNLNGKLHTLRIQIIYYAFRERNWKIFLKYYFQSYILSLFDFSLLKKFFELHHQILKNRFSKIV